jgi:oligosaccharide reducing-end xylanase
MLGKNIPQVGWPSCGEIDIMEHVNSNNTLYGTIHWNNNGHAQYGGNTSFNTSLYHTFGIEWDASAIRWYLDGTKYHEANIANNINNTGAFHEPFFIILNLAVGGTWPGNPDASTAFPDTMYVDYVRVYQQILNNAPPATITSSGVTTFCSGDSLVLNANAGAGYTYQWNKGGIVINGATGIKYAAKTSGSYTVTVSSNGLSTTSSATTVTVNNSPIAPTVNPTLTYCKGAIAQPLTASGTSLKWYTSASGATVLSSAPSPATGSTGTTNYYVSQTTNGCEGARAVIVVTVNGIPSEPSVTSPVTYCQNTAATALTATGTALKWYTSATGATALASAPTPATGSTGTINYYVSQTTNSCEGPRATMTVTVNSIPSEPSVTSPVTYCQNAAATALSATGTALKWYTSATGATALASAPSPATGSTGTTNYYVSQTINACEGARATVEVWVNEIPEATITPSGPITFVKGGSVTLQANTGTGLTYQWYNGNTKVGTGATYTTTEAGSYAVEVSNAYLCKLTSTATTVTVNPNQPSVITISSPGINSNINGPVTINVTVSNPDGGITLVEYLDGTTVIGTGTTSPYSFNLENPSSGTHVITVRATDSNGGVTTSSPVSFTTEITGISWSTAKEPYSNIYPNPTSENLNIKTSFDLSKATIQLLDALGAEVPLAITIIGKEAKADLSSLAEGTFFLLIRQDDQIIRRKITVIR